MSSIWGCCVGTPWLGVGCSAKEAGLSGAVGGGNGVWICCVLVAFGFYAHHGPRLPALHPMPQPQWLTSVLTLGVFLGLFFNFRRTFITMRNAHTMLIKMQNYIAAGYSFVLKSVDMSARWPHGTQSSHWASGPQPHAVFLTCPLTAPLGSLFLSTPAMKTSASPRT